MVATPDAAIAKVANALKDTWKVERIAPGHCTGEPTFAALKEAFGDRYVYAGLGTVLEIRSAARSAQSSAENNAMNDDELTTYRWFAQRDTMLTRLRDR